MNEKDAYKIIGKRKNGRYQRDSRIDRTLNSLELLREMMNQNMFKQMTFKDNLDLEDTINIDETKPLSASLPSNYKVVGYKFTDNGMVPELEYFDEEEENIEHHYYYSDDDNNIDDNNINESEDNEFEEYHDENDINKDDSSDNGFEVIHTIKFIDGIEPTKVSYSRI